MPTEIYGAGSPGGIRKWSGKLAADGHRDYTIVIRTRGGLGDGPATHMSTPGLPLPGSIWLYENTPDPWAWCDGADDCVGAEGNTRETFYDHTFTFSTRPRGQRQGGKDSKGEKQKCANLNIENPLAEPPGTSGGFVRGTVEATRDRFNEPIRYTSFEPITGPQAEFDESHFTVTVTQNVPNLQLSLVSSMKDHVSDAPLWDLPARCWKLSEFSWERKLYGVCFFYYTRRFMFEGKTRPQLSVNGEATGVLLSGWDREVPDWSNKCLNGHWDRTITAGTGCRWVLDNFADGTTPDFTKPAHYDLIPAPKGGGNIRAYLSTSSRGQPAVSEADIHKLTIEYHRQANFLQLGIPTVL
jgi:hypothetical protein